MLFVPTMLIRFLRFELDPETYRLTKDGDAVDLRPNSSPAPGSGAPDEYRGSTPFGR